MEVSNIVNFVNKGYILGKRVKYVLMYIHHTYTHTHIDTYIKFTLRKVEMTILLVNFNIG